MAAPPTLIAGVGVVFGFDDENVSSDFENKGGWGLVVVVATAGQAMDSFQSIAY